MNQVNRCWLHVGIQTVFTVTTGILCLADEWIKLKNKLNINKFGKTRLFVNILFIF